MYKSKIMVMSYVGVLQTSTSQIDIAELQNEILPITYF